MNTREDRFSILEVEQRYHGVTIHQIGEQLFRGVVGGYVPLVTITPSRLVDVIAFRISSANTAMVFILPRPQKG